MKFSVVIPAWRGKRLLKKNLPYVLGMGADEVIVVDASPDGDGDFVRKNFIKVKVVDCKENFGFGSNINRGVEETTGDVVILLNQDVKSEKDILKYLREDFRDDKVFGVSFAEQKYGPTKGVFKHGFVVHEPVKKRPEKLAPTFWANGGSSAIRKKFWDELGGFDDIYDPGYWEDIDLSFRAQRQGWKVLWDPRAKVKHASESSFGGKYYDQVYKRLIQERNHLLFNWLNLKDRKLRRIHFLNLFKRVVEHPGYLRIVGMACMRLLRSKRRKRTNLNQFSVDGREIFSVK